MVCKEYLACLALSDTNGKQLQGFNDKLKNALLSGKDLYPTMFKDLPNMLNNSKNEVTKIITCGDM